MYVCAREWFIYAHIFIIFTYAYACIWCGFDVCLYICYIYALAYCIFMQTFQPSLPSVWCAGGHCVYHYGWHQKTVDCLDDGTGRLIKLARTPLNASRHAHNVTKVRFGSANDDVTFFVEKKKKKEAREKLLGNMTTKQKILYKKQKNKARKQKNMKIRKQKGKKKKKQKHTHKK